METHATSENERRFQFSEGCPLKAIAFTSETRSNHGSPNSITIEPGNVDRDVFWRAMEKVVNDTKLVPDSEPRTYAECLEMGKEPPHRFMYLHGGAMQSLVSNRTLCGGENAYIEQIAPENVNKMVAKTLRLLKAHGLLREQDVVDAYREFSLSDRIASRGEGPAMMR
jgi:hypothetical protein